MGRGWLAAVALLCVSALAAGAQDATERQVKAAPGRDNRVAVYTNIQPDCTSGPLPAIRLVAAPAHGAVTVKRGVLKATNFKQCLATEVPVFVAVYRPAEGFSGLDEFELEVSLAGGRKQRQHFRVNVSANPGGGQGI
ncbi:MAG: hypothetical protein WBF03_17005 [Xanthobacteraceae bacterium]|jgi:uncharacterized membrane protein